MTTPQGPVAVLPPDWITVRAYAEAHGLPTGDITKLQLHGKAAMATLRQRGFLSMPKVYERADSGQCFWVYVYPGDVLAQAAWQVWR